VAKPTFGKDKHKKEDVADFIAAPQGLAVRAAEALRPHVKAIGIVVAGLVAVLIGMVVWSGLSVKKAARATDSFGKLIEEATATVDEAGPQVDLFDPNNPGAIKPAKYKTFQERTQAALGLATTLDFGSTAVAEKVKVVVAGLNYDAGKFDEAIAAYRAFLASEPGPELAARAREGIGYSLEAKALAQTDAAARNAGLDEALKAFTELAPDDKDSFHGIALYHQARIKALKGDKAGAVELLKKALEKEPTPDLADEINNRLALLEAK
jgi:tetratricopeptide (TPR) repeat protein